MTFPATLAARMLADTDRLMRTDRFAEAVTARLPDDSEHQVAGALWTEQDDGLEVRTQDQARMRSARLWLRTSDLPAMPSACLWFRTADPDTVWSAQSVSRRPGGITLIVLYRPEIADRMADPKHKRIGV